MVCFLGLEKGNSFWILHLYLIVTTYFINYDHYWWSFSCCSFMFESESPHTRDSCWALVLFIVLHYLAHYCGCCWSSHILWHCFCSCWYQCPEIISFWHSQLEMAACLELLCALSSSRQKCNSILIPNNHCLDFDQV